MQPEPTNGPTLDSCSLSAPSDTILDVKRVGFKSLAYQSVPGIHTPHSLEHHMVSDISMTHATVRVNEILDCKTPQNTQCQMERRDKAASKPFCLCKLSETDA